MSTGVTSVLVVGDGVAAAVAALAIARAFRPLGVAVTWLDRGRPGCPHLALAASPDLRAFHRLLRLEEDALLRATPATLRLGEQFVGWSGEGSAFLHAHGDVGEAYGALPFVQHWSRARRAGLRVALEDFCLAAVAAKHGRIRVEPGTPAMQHGYHLDAASYARLLEEACVRAGVRRVTDPAPQPRVAGDTIEAVALSSGETLSADLYVDADGALIDALAPQKTTTQAPVFDRAILASAAPLAPVPLHGRVEAHAAGYCVLTPLADRTAVAFHYDGTVWSDDAAAAALSQIAGVRILAQADPTSAASTGRTRAWVGNCVAVGPAMGTHPPLDGAAMLALQLAIGQLVLLWPLRRDAMPEAGIYNEEVAGHRARIADFTAQHFRLNRRTEPSWEAARAQPISDPLRAKLDLFAARGKFAHADHEAHVEDGWMLCMAGHGLVPRSSDPQAMAAEDAELMAEFQRQLRAIADRVGAMETHAAARARLAQASR